MNQSIHPGATWGHSPPWFSGTYCRRVAADLEMEARFSSGDLAFTRSHITSLPGVHGSA